MNAEQIIKALECCDGTLAGCKECPNYNNRYRCKIERDALALIKEQDQKIYSLENRLKECENGYEGTLYLDGSNVADIAAKAFYEKGGYRNASEVEENRIRVYIPGGIMTIAQNQAQADTASTNVALITDTVRKMQERLKEKAKAHYFDNSNFAVAVEDIDQIAKEIINESTAT